MLLICPKSIKEWYFTAKVLLFVERNCTLAPADCPTFIDKSATVMESYVMSYSLTLLDLMLPLFAQFLGNKIITYRFVGINLRSILSVRSTIAKLTGRCG